MSQDTYPYNFSNPVELNRYGYTTNDPVNRLDPSGHNFIEFAISLSKDAAVKGALLGAGVGAASALLCGGNVLGGALVGAGLGAAFATGYFGPVLTPILGIGGGALGLSTAYADYEENGITACNFINGVASLMAITGSFGGGGPSMQFALAGNTGGGSTGLAMQGVSPQVLTGLGAISTVSMISKGDDTTRNRINQRYPSVKVKGYGKVPFPKGRIEDTDPNPLRSDYTKEFRIDFRKWWYDKYGWYPDPGHYEIHHIHPLAKGGDNSYSNLVPLKPDQHLLFTLWWLYYP